MRCVLRAVGALSIVGAVAVTAPGGAIAATDPAPPATPALAYTLKSKNSAMWTVSANGRLLGISTWVSNRKTGAVTPTIEVVNVATGTSTTMKVPDAQYLPPDPSFSSDGRYLSWTTATSKPGPKRLDGTHKRKRPTLIWDPTTWVRDLTTGAVRKFKHYDGNFDRGDGSFLYVYRGPITRWTEPGNGPELPKAAGVLFLATGRFVALPAHAKTPAQVPVGTDTTPTGSKVAYVANNTCHVLTTATGAVATLGLCKNVTDLDLSDDGTTAFSDSLGGWVDATTGAKLGAPLDAAVLNVERGRSSVYGEANGDLSQIIVVCTPGLDPTKNDDSEWQLPRRTYLLDRTTRLYAPLAGPATPLDDTGFFVTGLILPTAAGDELFWGDGMKVWRESTAPTSTPAPLPADCQPA